jgi:hypothetical protein
MNELLKKHRAMSNRDGFPLTGDHIHFPRIRAFANGSIDFTEKENEHFDLCRVCRLTVVDALRNVLPLIVITDMAKAA